MSFYRLPDGECIIFFLCVRLEEWEEWGRMGDSLNCAAYQKDLCGSRVSCVRHDEIWIRRVEAA